MNEPRNPSSSAQNAATPPRTKWGRSRFGGSPGALIAISLVAGAPLAAGVGWLAMLAESGHPSPWLIFWVTAIVTWPLGAGLVWALLVDRSTLSGAPDDPDSSVESRWYDKAAAGAFHVLIVSLGLGAAVFQFLKVDVAPPLLLGGYFVLAVAAFGISYLFAKKTSA